MDAYTKYLEDTRPNAIFEQLIVEKKPKQAWRDMVISTMKKMQAFSSSHDLSTELFCIIIQREEDHYPFNKPWYTHSKAVKRYNYNKKLAHLHTLRMEDPNSPIVLNDKNPQSPFYSWVSTFHYAPDTGRISPSPSPILYTEKHGLQEYKSCTLFEWTCMRPGCQSKGLVGPFCNECCEKEAGVLVKSGSHGCGLFTNSIQEFKEKDIIVPYMGDLTNGKKSSHIYSVTRRNDSKVVDASCRRSTAAFINHDGTKPNVELDNIKEIVVCGVDNRGRIQLKDDGVDDEYMMTIPWSLLPVWFLDKQGLWIIAKTKIRTNTELLLNYGPESYWEELKENVKYGTTTEEGEKVEMCCSQELAGCECYQCRINRLLTTSAARLLQPPNTESETDDEAVQEDEVQEVQEVIEVLSSEDESDGYGDDKPESESESESDGYEPPGKRARFMRR